MLGREELKVERLKEGKGKRGMITGRQVVTVNNNYHFIKNYSNIHTIHELGS